MKKSHLKNIIKETILEEKGYSNFVPGKQTSGLDKKTLDNILLRIAKNERPSDEEHSAARGNRILDKADPINVDKILNGEKPEYEEVDRMQELAGIKNEIKVENPKSNDKICMEIFILVSKFTSLGLLETQKIFDIFDKYLGVKVRSSIHGFKGELRRGTKEQLIKIYNEMMKYDDGSEYIPPSFTSGNNIPL